MDSNKLDLNEAKKNLHLIKSKSSVAFNKVTGSGCDMAPSVAIWLPPTYRLNKIQTITLYQSKRFKNVEATSRQAIFIIFTFLRNELYILK